MSQPRLIDGFGRVHDYLRVSLTDRCNLRCTYCMPERGIDWARPESLLSYDEIVRLSGLFVALGITKIRLTGGEPLLYRDLLPLVETLSRMEGLKNRAMTTNAVRLAPVAQALRDAGLTSITISLDSLKSETFAAITRRDRLRDVMEGIEAALAAGFAPLKLNIVIMANVNDGELMDFVRWGLDRPVDLRFIEYMPFPDTRWSQAGLVPYAEMRDRIAGDYALIPLPGEKSAVGKSFAITGHAATVSFVSSMTESFCGDCSRLRLTADGNIKACLFHPDERSLRDLMRDGCTDATVREAIFSALRTKPEAHAPMEDLLKIGNRAMIAIGG